MYFVRLLVLLYQFQCVVTLAAIETITLPTMASFTFKANFIKSKVVLSTLLSRYGELTPMSDTSFKSLCFFHNDIRPSMQINDLPTNSPYYYCHSCGANGDFIKFLSKKAKVSNGRVLQDVYSVLSSGGSFLT